MLSVFLPRIGTVAIWRSRARALALAGVPAGQVLWRIEGDGGSDLFAGGEVAAGKGKALHLPREAIATLETALCHSDPERFHRAYDLVLRLSEGSLRWGDRSDVAMLRLLQQEKAVHRDIHKMHAFVRFRELSAPGATRRAFAAWFQPDHPIVEAAAPFFARRFGDMDWIIATPGLTARFEAGQLSFSLTEPGPRPPPDATEDLWRTYFANIFNPARLMVSAMTSEMPRKYWKNLPEAALIPEMIRQAPARARAMQEAAPTFPLPHVERILPQRPALPEGLSLATMKPALDACRRCPIGGCATQAVAGEGPGDAGLMIVGEQPGDAEDLAGRPFVGPAGQVFDRCATAAGLSRSAAYLTNAVKHFKFLPRGKRRLHQRPTAGEVVQCRWWLDLERKLLRPKLILALGATAAEALTGSGARLLQRCGTEEAGPDGIPVLISLHPAHALRLPDPTARAEAETRLTRDLARAWAITKEA
ncbi:UdgX family uracil-DNA binding protein [Tabrizicola sp.]|uniref:UdgX family uracil-DNA binding protein n=1 Tax=Tabrizicola sp. TaxID=2005166 RepID=UPI002FDE1313